MKSLLKPALPLLLLALLTQSTPTQAQVRVNVNVNVPAWGPPVGPGAQYYYIPEIDGYYDLYNQSYVYFDPYYQTWVSTPALPSYYAGYDPRYFHPVVVQYVGAQPWGLIYDHRTYCNTRGWRPGYYRSAPGPGWRGGYGGYGAPGYGRTQPAPGYYNRPYNQGGYAHRDNDDRRGGYYTQPAPPQGNPGQPGGWRNDDRRGGYDNDRREQPNGPGRPDFGQGQPGGRGWGGNGGHGGGRGHVR